MHKFIYILLFLFPFSSHLQAQDKKEMVRDSIVMIQEKLNDSIERTVHKVGIDQGDNASNGPEYLQQNIDTTLHFSQFSISPDTIQSWKNLKTFAYARYLDSLLKERQKKDHGKENEGTMNNEVAPSSGPSWLDNVFSSIITRVIFWTLAGIFVLYILYKLFLTEGYSKRKTSAQTPAEPEISEEIITGESDFDRNISQAIRSSNYRLAVRYQYLRTLYKLADKHFIELAADKTNYQYVRELKNRDYQNNFASLTLNYEYVWYGEFNINENVYRKIAARFSEFNQQIQPNN